jgi:hypothetical protein
VHLGENAKNLKVARGRGNHKKNIIGGNVKLAYFTGVKAY